MQPNPPKHKTSLFVRMTTGLVTLNGFRLTGLCLILIAFATAVDQNSRIPFWIHERIPILSQSLMAVIIGACGAALTARDYRVGAALSPLPFTIPLYFLFIMMLAYVQQGVNAPPSFFSYSLIFTGLLHVMFVGFHSATITEYQKEIAALLIEREVNKAAGVDNVT